MSIECPECGERVDALPIHTCRKGGDIKKELAKLRDWHTETARTRVNVKKKAKHTAYAYLADAAMAMIWRQDKIIATRDKTIASLKAQLNDGAQPFTDPDRPNYISR